MVFQHDNDPKHTAKLTQQLLRSKPYKVLDWPAQSPDLNPIEHLWNEVQRRLRKNTVHISSVSSLWMAVEDAWNTIEQSICEQLIRSMPNRVAAVIKAKGGYTKY